MTLQQVGRCVMGEKQPPYEIHGMAFATPKDVIVGAENGHLYVAKFSTPPAAPNPKKPEGAETASGAMTSVTPFPFAELTCTFANAQELDDLRHPRRHDVRVRSIVSCSDTLVTADTNGVIIAWTIEAEQQPAPSASSSKNKKDTAGVEAGAERSLSSLRFRCSANCRGRVTAIALLPQDFQPVEAS